MGDAVRAAELLGNSAALAFIACLIALPPGVFSGYLLSRRGIRGIRIARFLILLGLCTPLPVTALAWQIVLSAWLPPLTLNPGEVAWRPWSRGLFPAGIIHGIAAWPWLWVLLLCCCPESIGNWKTKRESMAANGPYFVACFGRSSNSPSPFRRHGSACKPSRRSRSRTR